MYVSCRFAVKGQSLDSAIARTTVSGRIRRHHRLLPRAISNGAAGRRPLSCRGPFVTRGIVRYHAAAASRLLEKRSWWRRRRFSFTGGATCPRCCPGARAPPIASTDTATSKKSADVRRRGSRLIPQPGGEGGRALRPYPYLLRPNTDLSLSPRHPSPPALSPRASFFQPAVATLRDRLGRLPCPFESPYRDIFHVSRDTATRGLPDQGCFRTFAPRPRPRRAQQRQGKLCSVKHRPGHSDSTSLLDPTSSFAPPPPSFMTNAAAICSGSVEQDSV